jgi:SAM-dependent methyltransferase
LWSDEPSRFLAEEAADLAPGRALDLGTGEGRNAVWLAEQGWRVTGVDFSDVALSRARNRAVAKGVRVDWVLADLVSYEPPRNSFDLVAILYVHILPADRRTGLDRAAGALVPGGILLVVGHDRSNLTEGNGGPRDPAVLYTPEEIARELPGLQIERAERVCRSVEAKGRDAPAIEALVRARRRASSGPIR